MPTKTTVETCARIELVVAIHTLASSFENALYKFGGDVEARTKAEGDIAHAMKIAAKHNQNGASCATHTFWNTQAVEPSGPETAVIAITLDNAAPEDASPFLLGEVFRFDPHHRRWFGETSGLLLRRDKFWWAREEDVLAGLTPDTSAHEEGTVTLSGLQLRSMKFVIK